MSKVLLTGGLGFIGHTIVRKLEDTEHTPIIVDNKSDYDGAIDRVELEKLMQERISLFKTDVTTYYTRPRLIPGINNGRRRRYCKCNCIR